VPNKDQAIGGLICLVCVVVAIGYAATLFFPQHMLGWLEPLTVQLWIVAIPVLVAFLALLSIGAWIGWTMATTPTPRPIEEIQSEEKAEFLKFHQTIEKSPK
jgi:predicted DNA-binding transcriptional regulator